MKYLYLALNWGFGVPILAIGLLSMFESLLAGLSLVLISLLILPPFRVFVYSKTNRELSTRVRAASILFLIVSFSVFVNQSQTKKVQDLADTKMSKQATELAKLKQDNINYFKANREQIILTANTALTDKNYQLVLTQTDRYLASGDEELKSINSLARQEIEKLKKLERTTQLLAELKEVPSAEYEKNKALYQQLVSLNPDNQTYKDKVELYSKKLNDLEQERIRIESRIKRIEKQFSPWDGSHRVLEKLIKRAMNDPNSYEHAETIYWDKGDFLVVQTTYRGKNAFGGVVKNFVRAKVSLDGQILQVLDQT